MSDRAQPTLTGVQILRGVAAALVAGHHTLDETLELGPDVFPAGLVRIGAVGVDLFFVISGFIMMWVSFGPGRRCASPRAFLLKRALRIYPFYLACCALVLLLKATGISFSRAPSDPWQVWTSLALVPLHEEYLLAVSWTLECEVYFYLLFALCLFRRSPRVACLGTCALLALGYVSARWIAEPTLRVFLGTELHFEFCMGLALGYLACAHDGWPRAARYAFLVGIAGVVWATQLGDLPASTLLPNAQRFWVWGAPAVLIVASAAAWAPGAGRVTRAAACLGDASYAVYLTHPFVLIAYAKALRTWSELRALPQAPVVVLVWLATLALGIGAHLLIERPLLRLKDAAARRWFRESVVREA